MASGNYKQRILVFFLITGLCVLFLGMLASGFLTLWNTRFEGRAYPGVMIGDWDAGGQTQEGIVAHWLEKNSAFADVTFELRFESHVATISAASMDLGYDATLSATQAIAVGRSGNRLSDLYEKLVKRRAALTPLVRWNEDALTEALDELSSQIDIPVSDALFQFSGGRVTAFRASRDGREVNREEAIKRFQEAVAQSPYFQTKHYTIALPVTNIPPSITTDRVNSFGIKELIGRGYSEFAGSIPGRIHNIVLAASRIHGVLIKPGETFSFNKTVGDISASTGYQTAYIIKDGRTVLGDGGGVCQVSTTIFRAALAAGLPITERHAHAYRVSYYEQANFKAGLDATVFSPTVDFQFTNDTPGYILIQAKPDTENLSLTFELYGTSDGRSAEILNHTVGGISAPPPALYQDDPTLAPGVVKQVDFPAWGAKASLLYRVTRRGEVINEQTFVSNFRPWQAVYLRGPQI